MDVDVGGNAKPVNQDRVTGDYQLRKTILSVHALMACGWSSPKYTPVASEPTTPKSPTYPTTPKVTPTKPKLTPKSAEPPKTFRSYGTRTTRKPNSK